jgi:sulfur-oxidizing protein SoxX
MKDYPIKQPGLTGAVALIAGQLLFSSAVLADNAMAEKGKEIAFDRKKGNCLACHMIEGGTAPGNIAPPLVAMKGRYPNKQKLWDQIFDPLSVNPESAMPPFGKHEILTKPEMEKVVEYIWTL